MASFEKDYTGMHGQQNVKTVGVPHRQSGRLGEEKNLFPWPSIKPQFIGCPARSLVPVLTTLQRHVVHIATAAFGSAIGRGLLSFQIAAQRIYLWTSRHDGSFLFLHLTSIIILDLPFEAYYSYPCHQSDPSH